MLCCRPMLSLAAAVALGVMAARYQPWTTGLIPYGWLLFVLLSVWFARTPQSVPPVPDDFPDGYAGHIFPRPGYLARRGLNRFILILCLPCLLVGMMRQQGWEEELSVKRLPEETFFHGTFLALAPKRDFPGQEGAWRIPALLLTVDGERRKAVAVRLSGHAGEDFRRGDIVQGRARRAALHRQAFPGAFDFGFWLERDGLAGAVYLVKPLSGEGATYSVTAVDAPPLHTRVRRIVDAVRGQAIAATLRHGGESGGLLAAMLYGYRKDIADEVRDAFRRVGIGHVLAISGLHVGLIVGLLWWLSGWLGWGQRWRATACLALVLFYLGLTGGQVAASRAACMAAIHLAGIAWGRRSDMMNSLGAAALLLILLNPTAPLDISFQLSFTAVVFIYMALGGRPDRDRPRSAYNWNSPTQRALRSLNSLIRLSIATWIGLFPIIAFVFNQVNLIGLPINVVVIPLMSLVLAGGLLLPWLAWLPGAAWLLTLPTRALAWIAAWADGLPYSSFAVHAPGRGWLLAFYLFVLLLLLRGMLRNSPLRLRWDIFSGAGLVVACIGLIISMRSAPPPAEGRITHLPGRHMGLVVAQTNDGHAVVLGSFSRGGLIAAEWLHHVRHGNGVSVVALGRAGRDSLAALDWHFPIREFVRHPTTDKNDTGPSVWLAAPGVPEVQYAIGRDSRGKALWLEVRLGDHELRVTPGR